MGAKRLRVNQDDIFCIDVDAIVNPANISLLAGGGLCGKIHKIAGPELELRCKTIGPQAYGNAVITPSYGLKNCDHIIHACGPRWLDGHHDEINVLERTHEAIIRLAINEKLSTIAIPAISTGIYRFPVAVAAQAAISTVNAMLKNVDLEVYFVINEQEKYHYYQNACAKFVREFGFDE